ncbi:hypothetical protein D3C76_1473870 [compost metagenome]
MIADGIVVRFARLGHDIADEDFDRIRFYNGLSQLGNQQVGQDAGVQAAGSAQNGIRVPDCLKRLR